MAKNKKETRGGKRANSGRKPKFNVPTCTVHILVPQLNREEIVKKFNEILDAYRNR